MGVNVRHQTLDELIKGLNDDFKGFQVIAESDKTSSLIKSVLLRTRKVVSDRDVSTLKYEVCRFAIQNLGLKITDDFYYPYLNLLNFEPEKIKKAIDLVKSIPEIFLETELYEVMLDFIKDHPEGKEFYLNFLETLHVIKSAFESKNIPRSFALLLIDQLPIHEKMIFLKEDIQGLSQSFFERVSSSGCQIYGDERIEWVKELDLYAQLKNDTRFSFLNFPDQIQETRYALKSLAKSESNGEAENTVVFYPEGFGYETLLYIYQKEFFVDQQLYMSESERNNFQNGLDLIKNKEDLFLLKYKDSRVKNQLKAISYNDGDRLELPAIISVFFNNDSSEYALSIWSELMIQLGEKFSAKLEDWNKILTYIHHRNVKRSLKLHTGLNLYSFDSYPLTKPEKIIILGWSENIFERVSQKHLSNSVLLELESTLGFENQFLYKNKARVLFKKEIMYDETVTKEILCSKVDLKGNSKYPGIFKILKDNQNQKGLVNREYSLEKNSKVTSQRKPLLYRGSVSSSSVTLYDTCPYKFYLEKVLGLKEEQESEYHLLPLEEGRLLHSILENLKTNKDITFKEFESDMIKMFTNQAEEHIGWRKTLAEKKAKQLWEFFDSERRFLESNEISIYAVEKKFEFYADPVNRSFSIDKSPGAIKVRGSIDRIDIDRDSNVILYDYKRRSSGVYTVGSYTGVEVKPQIFLYYLAAKLGAVGEFSNIIGFQFISLESQTREKGFLFKEFLKTGEDLVKEKTSLINQDKFDSKLKVFENKFFEILDGVLQRDFQAKPIKADTCKGCYWKGICKKSKTFL